MCVFALGRHSFPTDRSLSPRRTEKTSRAGPASVRTGRSDRSLCLRVTRDSALSPSRSFSRAPTPFLRGHGVFPTYGPRCSRVVRQDRPQPAGLFPACPALGSGRAVSVPAPGPTEAAGDATLRAGCAVCGERCKKSLGPCVQWFESVLSCG